jgi:hypothetical protein
MFEALLWATAGLVVIAVLIAWDSSRDILHPLIFMGPMFAFLYAWMPMQLFHTGALDAFFDKRQLVPVQILNLAGVAAFLFGCLAASWGVRRVVTRKPFRITETGARRLVVGGAIVGAIGMVAWAITIHNVGGFVNAFSEAHAGGWDDSGYVRDSSLLLYSALILIISAGSLHGMRAIEWGLASVFAMPLLTQALLGARRGPTFAVFLVIAMSWLLYRNIRPSVLATIVCGVGLGYLILFLIANRNSIHLGSDFDFSTDVTRSVAETDTGNEYIYGTGAVLASQHLGQHFWGKRYLAQVLVRPIPSAVWPTKYADFGVPELLENAGTGAGIADTMGWQGAVGSAPGIVSDLYLEMAWLAVPFLAALGFCYGRTWRLALSRGGPWTAQYIILSALSIYLIMQTMEAVIFRVLLLSIPAWLVWKWAMYNQPSGAVQRAN